MPCSKCENKLASLATPSVKKASDLYGGVGAPRSTGSSAPERKIGENKMLSKPAKKRFTPYATTCGDCGLRTHQGGKYCQKCAYKRGVCGICGKKILDTSAYKMSVK